MLTTMDPVEIAQVTLQFLRQMISFERASIILIDHDTEEFIILATEDRIPAPYVAGSRLLLTQLTDLDRLRSEAISFRTLNKPDTPISQKLFELGIKSIVNSPLHVQGSLIGVLNLGKITQERLSEAEMRILLEVSNALAAALQQAQLFAKERQQRELAQTLHGISRALASSLELEQVLDLILEQLARLVPFDSASVLLKEGDLLRNVAYRTIYRHTVRLPQLKISDFRHIQELFSTQEPQIIADTLTDRRWQTPAITSSIRSWLGIPLNLNEKCIGLINLSKAEPDFYNKQAVETTVIFATQAVNAIENARLFTSERKARKTAETLQAANIALTQSLELDTILTTLLSYLSGIIPYDSASVLLVDQEGKKATLHLGKGYEQHSGMSPPKNLQFQIDQTPNIQRLVESQKGFIIADTQQDEGWKKTPISAHIRNWLGVPLIAGGNLIGLFSLDKCEPGFFTTEDLQAAETLAAQAAVAIQNSRLFQETRSRTTELEALSNFSKALRLATSMNEMLHIILEMATFVIACDTARIYLLDPVSGQFTLRYSLPEEPPDAHIIIETPDQATPVKTWPTSITSLPDSTGTISAPAADAHQSNQIELPLQTQERTVGFIILTLSAGHHTTKNKNRLLNAIADIAGSALHRAIILETLEQRIWERTYELAAANEQLLELDRLKSKFIADISHEFRTPLANLRLYLDLFSRGPAEKQEQYLSVLHGQTIRLVNLVEDVLSLSHIEAQTDAASLTNIDLNQMIKTVLMRLESTLRQHNNTIILELDDNLPTMRGIPQQIEQVITNLVANASSYAENGNITLWSGKQSDGIQFQIQDTGSGISAEDLPHIFDRFYRGRKTGQSALPGTGLGLAIVKEIVARHNGHIDVTSQINQGTTFTLRFPVNPAANQ